MTDTQSDLKHRLTFQNNDARDSIELATIVLMWIFVPDCRRISSTAAKHDGAIRKGPTVQNYSELVRMKASDMLNGQQKFTETCKSKDFYNYSGCNT